MNIKELRIENYASYKGQIIKVCQFSKSTFWYINGDTLNEIRNDIDKLEPIELTEEWLLKFGFEKVEEESFYKKQVGNNLSLFVDLNNKSYGINLDWKDSSYIEIWRNLDYVHNLQNLYFALANEELELIKNS